MRFEEYYQKVKPEIEEKIREIFLEEDQSLKNVFDFALKGGKRFRPVLCMLCCDVLDGDREKAKRYAAVIEFIHAASLLHDDLVDNDQFRRNLPTLWRVASKIVCGINKVSLFFRGRPVTTKDLSIAILTGDGLLAKALKLVESPEAISVISDGVYSLLLGAVREIKNAKEYTESAYLDVIALKTAALFATACHLGAMTSDVEDKYKEYCREYGKNLGMLYQLLDDWIDEDCPEFVTKDPLRYFRRYVENCRFYVSLLPSNEYREAMEDAIVKILEKFSKEADKNKRRQIKSLLDSIKTSS